MCTLAIPLYENVRIYKQFSAEKYCILYVDQHTRTFYFTGEDGRYVKTFHVAVNRSFTNKMLNTYLMKMIVNTFKEGGDQKCSLQAVSCIGQQPESKVWVLNSTTQIESDGELIKTEEREFLWITDKIIALRGLDNGKQPSTF